jgi:hypothetical protein
MARNTLQVQEYLKKRSLLSLTEEYHVAAKRHSQFPNLILLKYDQIESPMDHPIVQECRGIILDETNNWRVVARPYDKFFNLGETNAAPIDWSTAQVLEKLDGTLITMYYYNEAWQIATSGTPDASGSVGALNKTFAVLFWEVWFNELHYDFPEEKDQNITFMFELMTPWNKVVVQHKESRIVLHGIRYNDGDMQELNPVYAAKYNWKRVKTYPFAEGVTPQAVKESANELVGTVGEGFVVVDHLFNRVKVKGEDYLRLHRMIDGMSQRKMLDIIRINEGSEFLTYFPEWTELYNELKNKYQGLVDSIAAVYTHRREIENQKDFALAVKDLPYSGALFAIRSGKMKSFQEYFANCNIKTLEQLLGMKDND